MQNIYIETFNTSDSHDGRPA